MRDVASGKEIHDFRHSDHNKQARNNDTSRKSKYINYSAERQKILSHCHVVCTTLSGAGSKAFIESGKSGDKNIALIKMRITHPVRMFTASIT